MIIGLVGPVDDDIELVKGLIEENIQTVDTVELFRSCDRKTMNSLSIHDYHKKYFLRNLEDKFGTVILVGNLLLSEDIDQYILQQGGIIVVVSRRRCEDYDEDILQKTEAYWGEKSTQKYNLEVRFKVLYNNLKKTNDGVDNLFFIDVSDEESEDLDTLVESCSDWNSSKLLTDDIMDFVKLATVKEDVNMRMEDSIKKAMKELGMDVDFDEGEVTEEQPKKPEKSERKPVKQVKKIEKVMNELIDDEDEPENTPEEVSSLFVKITDGTMALLLPEDLVLEKQTIGDMKFNVATVELPDFTSHKLQELVIKVGKVEPKQSVSPVKDQKPVKVSKSSEKKPAEKSEEKKISKVVVVSGNLTDLQNEKSRLDKEIKNARSEGNEELVLSLRKQRRAVRNKIRTIINNQK